VTEESVETFRPTSGRVFGVIGLLGVVVLLVLGVVEGFPVWVLGLVATIGVLVWSAMLRPGVRIVGDKLELRDMFRTSAVPLAAIEDVAVRRVLVVRAGERRFVSPAIGRTLRQTMRSQPTSGAPTDGRDLVALAASSYPDYVEGRIRTAAADHRARLGIRAWSDEQQALARDVRREPAWPELGVLAVALLVSLVGIVLAP
jgi:hypothetical protein